MPGVIDFGQFRLRPALFFDFGQLDFGQLRLRPITTSANYDFGQFRLRPISTSANSIPANFWMLNFGTTKCGALEVWAPKGGSPNLEKMEPRRVEPRKWEAQRVEAPNLEKVGPRREEPRRVEPRRVGGPKFRFFFPLLPQFSFFFLSLGVLAWNFGGVRSAGALKCARLEFSGCRVRAPAAPPSSVVRMVGSQVVANTMGRAAMLATNVDDDLPTTVAVFNGSFRDEHAPAEVFLADGDTESAMSEGVPAHHAEHQCDPGGRWGPVSSRLLGSRSCHQPCMTVKKHSRWAVLQAAFRSIEEVDVLPPFSQRAAVMRSVPRFLKCSFCKVSKVPEQRG